MDVTQPYKYIERGTAVQQSDEPFYFIPRVFVRADKIHPFRGPLRTFSEYFIVLATITAESRLPMGLSNGAGCSFAAGRRSSSQLWLDRRNIY